MKPVAPPSLRRFADAPFCRFAFLLGPLLLASCWASDTDRKSLQQGYALYNTRHLDESEAIANAYIVKFNDDPNIDEAYYLRGLSRLTRAGSAGSASKEAAAADLRTAIAKTQRPDLKAKASRALGDIDFDATRWKDAQADYEQALAIYLVPGPNDTKPPAASPQEIAHLDYRLGACLQALGQWDKAQPYFQRVVVNHAGVDSYLTERALSRMNFRNFAIQFGAFQDGPKAGELVRQLNAAGIPAAVTSEMREGKLLFIVRYGNFPTWADANVSRDRLQPKYPLVTIVP